MNINKGDRIIANVSLLNASAKRWSLSITNLDTPDTSIVILNDTNAYMLSADWIDEAPIVENHAPLTNFVNASFGPEYVPKTNLNELQQEWLEHTGYATITTLTGYSYDAPISDQFAFDPIYADALNFNNSNYSSSSVPSNILNSDGKSFKIYNFRFAQQPQLNRSNANITAGEPFTINVIVRGGTGEYNYSVFEKEPNGAFAEIQCPLFGYGPSSGGCEEVTENYLGTPLQYGFVFNFDSSATPGEYSFKVQMHDGQGPQEEFINSTPINVTLRPPHLNITLFNNQSTPTSLPFQQLIRFNASTYQSSERGDLGNLRFYTIDYVPLNAICIENCVNSTHDAKIFVKTPGNWTGNYTVVLGFLPFNVTYNGTTWGEAPELSASYGEYNNAPDVFDYWVNFGGLNETQGLPQGWELLSSEGNLTYNARNITLGGETAQGIYASSLADYLNPRQNITIDSKYVLLTEQSGFYGYFGYFVNTTTLRNLLVDYASFGYGNMVYRALDTYSRVEWGIGSEDWMPYCYGGGCLYPFSEITSLTFYDAAQNGQYTNITGRILSDYNEVSLPAIPHLSTKLLDDDVTGGILQFKTYNDGEMSLYWLGSRNSPPNGIMPEVTFGETTTTSTTTSTTSISTSTSTSTTSSTLTSTISTGSVDMIGDTSGSRTYSTSFAYAYNIIASDSGALQSAGLNVQTASGNLEIGLYSDSGGSPHTLLANSITSTAVSGWNDFVLYPNVTISTGTHYWIALFTDSGALAGYANLAASDENRCIGYHTLGSSWNNPFSISGCYSGDATNLRMTYGGGSTTTTTSTSTTSTSTSTSTSTLTSTISSGTTDEFGSMSGNRDYSSSFAYAYNVIASDSGTLQELCFNIYSTGGNLEMALYSNSGGYPSALLSNSVSAVATSGWNCFTMPSVSITIGTPYWIATYADGALFGYENSSAAGVTRCIGSHSLGTWNNPYGVAGCYSGEMNNLRMTYGASSTTTSTTSTSTSTTASTTATTSTSTSTSTSTASTTSTSTSTSSTATTSATTTIPSAYPNVTVLITNEQAVGTGAGFQQRINFDAANALFQNATSDLGNVRFYLGPDALYSWCESGCTSSSASATFWVAPMEVSANSNAMINMTFGSAGYDCVQAGIAPDRSGTYGACDNMKYLFPVLSDNFTGSSQPSDWTYSGSVTFNDGLHSQPNAWAGTTTAYAFANQILEFNGNIEADTNANWWNIAGFTPHSTNAANSPVAGWGFDGNGRTAAGQSAGTSYASGSTIYTYNGIFSTHVTASSGGYYYYNYTLIDHITDYTPSGSQYIGVSQWGGNHHWTIWWVRLRNIPPNGVMPAVSFG